MHAMKLVGGGLASILYMGWFKGMFDPNYMWERG